MPRLEWRRFAKPIPRRVGAAVPLLAVLAIAALVRTWNLGQNAFGRQYYAAGVRSMSESWHNFLYNSFDPAGFLSLDKPPLAIWLQVVGAKLFGFSWMSILLPQVVSGLAAILRSTCSFSAPSAALRRSVPRWLSR
jgi:4-amino-4-deoxy-L-arabinose transferase-like glycosyltransferase